MTRHKGLWSKFVFILLAIVLVGSMVIIAACGDNNNDNTPTKTTLTKTTPPATTPAKTTPAATTPTAETPTGTGHKGDLTIDSKIDLLVANPDVNALLRHCLGDEMMDNPALPIMAPLYTLSEVIPLTPDLTPEKIQCIKDGLAAMPE
jgi:hypothetical protein